MLLFLGKIVSRNGSMFGYRLMRLERIDLWMDDFTVFLPRMSCSALNLQGTGRRLVWESVEKAYFLNICGVVSV